MLSNHRPLHSSVVGFAWYYPSHAATRIWSITFSARNKVNVAMHYRLASSRAAVDSYVESQHSRILCNHEISGFSKQLLACSHLSGPKVEIIRSMPLGDNEEVPVRYREFVPHGHSEAILKQDRSIAREAERATRFHMLIGGPNSSEISVIPVSLHRVTGNRGLEGC